MAYRNANYAAFYVDEPFSGNLGAYKARDFCYYQTLKMWKSEDASFPFIDAHAKTYNVRDSSSWESTLKPRLHERLLLSKNIVLFLSSHTRQSRALREELEYGMGDLGLPVIVVYPGFNPVNLCGNVSRTARDLWELAPSFRSHYLEVPTLHVPMEKAALSKALSDPDFVVQSKTIPGIYRLEER